MIGRKQGIFIAVICLLVILLTSCIDTQEQNKSGEKKETYVYELTDKGITVETKTVYDKSGYEVRIKDSTYAKYRGKFITIHTKKGKWSGTWSSGSLRYIGEPPTEDNPIIAVYVDKFMEKTIFAKIENDNWIANFELLEPVLEMELTTSDYRPIEYVYNKEEGRYKASLPLSDAVIGLFKLRTVTREIIK